MLIMMMMIMMMGAVVVVMITLTLTTVILSILPVNVYRVPGVMTDGVVVMTSLLTFNHHHL